MMIILCEKDTSNRKYSQFKLF